MKLQKILKVIVFLAVVIVLSFYLFIVSQTSPNGDEVSVQGTFIGIEKNSENINGPHTFMGVIPTTFYRDAVLIKTSDGSERFIPISSKSQAFKKTGEDYRYEISFSDIPIGTKITGWCRLLPSINTSYSSDLKEITVY